MSHFDFDFYRVCRRRCPDCKLNVRGGDAWECTDDLEATVGEFHSRLFGANQAAMTVPVLMQRVVFSARLPRSCWGIGSTMNASLPDEPVLMLPQDTRAPGGILMFGGRNAGVPGRSQ